MAGTLNLSGFKLTYDDEFNTFSGSPTGGPGSYQTEFNNGSRSIPSNGEHEFYSDSTVGVNPFSLQNGALNITAAPGGPAAYTSGLITTYNNFSQTYGYFEMRAQLPQGQGFWPAFWLLPQDKSWPPELDPLEAFGAPNANGEGGSNKYHVGMIAPNSAQSNGAWETVPANIYTGYHTYGVDWEPDHVTYYFDGQQMAQFATPAGMDKPMYLLANLAVGGNWPGSENASTGTGHLMIDYIRAYSNSASATAVALQHVSSPDGTDTTAFLHGATTANGVPSPSPAPAPAPAPTPAPVPVADPTVGSGSDKLVLNLSEDAFQGDAQFTVTIDGKQIGGVQTVTASHAAGTIETFSFLSDQAAGAHQVAVNFINDAYGGSSSMDRNLYVNSASYDGTAISGAAKPLFSNGADTFSVTDTTAIPGVTPAPSPAPGPTPMPFPTNGGTFGSGSDKLVLGLSEDAFQGDAQFTVSVDGKQIGGTYSVTASHSAGGDETFTFLADEGVGAHQVAVNFINDAYGGSTSTDRNLYVDSASYDGLSVSGAAKPLFSNGADAFSVTDTTAIPGAAPAPSPAPAPTPTPTPSASGAATATPGESRAYVAPDATGAAHGTAGADDIYAAGAGQTLIGGGGDDIFHIGTNTDAKIVVGTSGITTVSTWASNYTLASGVNDLSLAGNYAHTVHGNGLNNWITASDANDTIFGGGGNVTIQAGLGADNLTGGGQHDWFVFNKAADANSVINDFHAASDVLDLRGLIKDAGYTGSNPVADHVLSFVQSGTDTVVMVDPDGSGPTAAHTLVTLHDVVASSLITGNNYLWH